MNLRRRGFTLVEILIASVVALLLLTVGWGVLSMAGKTYSQIAGRDDAGLQLRKASRHLQRDLQASSSTDVLVAPVPGPGGLSGDAICVKSAARGDDARGSYCVTSGGSPYWQRNVLFYTARPTGDSCLGGADADGYEDMCPHKVLIRKVIDSDLPTSPGGSPSTDKEAILSDLTPYLTLPDGLSTTDMLAEPGVTNAEIVATGLLTMQLRFDPDPNAPGEIAVTLLAFDEFGSRGTVNIGTELLSGHDKTLTHLVSVFPRNAQ